MALQHIVRKILSFISNRSNKLIFFPSECCAQPAISSAFKYFPSHWNYPNFNPVHSHWPSVNSNMTDCKNCNQGKFATLAKLIGIKVALARTSTKITFIQNLVRTLSKKLTVITLIRAISTRIW